MSMFAERLNIAIKDAGVTKAYIARRVGISSSQITEYCKGKCEPKSTCIYKLACALNVSETWLIGIDGALKTRVETMSSELSELIRIYKSLDTKRRNQLLAFAYSLEDGNV